jgi:phage baseplate assembly protein W
MGSLNINYIKRPDVTKKGHLYSDLYLDLQNDYKIRSNLSKESTKLVDIKVSYDENAIKNSLNALLNTNPGQRLLLPEYGVNIKRYIFSPVSENNAYSIGEFIKDAIERWEPRVSVSGITIKPVISDARYDIFLDLYAPSLGKRIGFLSELVRGEGINFK